MRFVYHESSQPVPPVKCLQNALCDCADLQHFRCNVDNLDNGFVSTEFVIGDFLVRSAEITSIGDRWDSLACQM